MAAGLYTTQSPRSRSWPDRLQARRAWLVSLAAFVLLAVVHTWPLGSNPAHLSRNDQGDALMCTWAIAWVAHQLPRDPLHLFDANIFYPERLTLGYSEAMIVQGVMAMPVIWLGGSPVLAYNLVLIAGFALTGWAFCLLIRRWTGSWAAGYVGGSLAAFNSHVLVRLAHLQTQHVEFVALMLFALDRLVMSRRVRDALLLGLGFALQGLTSVYLLVFSTWTLTFAVLARSQEWMRREPLRMIALLTVSAVAAALILAPYLYWYSALHAATGLERRVEDTRVFAGSWIDYLATGSRLHFGLWSQRFFRAAMSPAFPGLVAVGLTGMALAWAETRRDPRVRMCLIVAIGCATVSVLPLAPFYPLLHRTIPLFRAVRVPAHLGQIVLLMIAVVAGYGVAGLGRRWPNPKSWPAAGAVILLLVNAEALRSPLGYTPFTAIPSVYDVLAREPTAVVVEMPFFPPRAFSLSAPYMLNSTRHWRPILNGYSGFRPGSYDRAYEAVQGFPNPASLIAMHGLGVTHVVVHMEEFCVAAGPECPETVARSASLEPVAESGDIHIYRLR